MARGAASVDGAKVLLVPVEDMGSVSAKMKVFERCLARAEDVTVGALRAMAREVIAEWRLAAASPEFRAWLTAGAHSEDRA